MSFYLNKICILYHLVVTTLYVDPGLKPGGGHLGQVGHILSRSSGSDPVYEISESDPNFTLNHMQ